MPVLEPRQFIEAFYHSDLNRQWAKCVWRVNYIDAIDSFYDWFVVRRMAWMLRVPFPLDKEEIAVRLQMGEYRILGVVVIPVQEPGFRLELQDG